MCLPSTAGWPATAASFSVDFHLREARRLGLSDPMLTEAVEVVQLFNTVTKIADALQLQPDFPHTVGKR